VSTSSSPSGSSSTIVRVLVPVGMLGGGFPAETITRGIALGADIIAIDGGSTDSGPHYLVSRVVSDFTVRVRDNGVCLLLRRLCCVPVMSRN